MSINIGGMSAIQRGACLRGGGEVVAGCRFFFWVGVNFFTRRGLFLVARIVSRAPVLPQSLLVEVCFPAFGCRVGVRVERFCGRLDHRRGLRAISRPLRGLRAFVVVAMCLPCRHTANNASLRVRLALGSSRVCCSSCNVGCRSRFHAHQSNASVSLA